MPDNITITKIMDAIPDILDNYISFAIDIGFSNGWEVIEFNDFVSLGSYGLEPSRYMNAAIARWLQLIDK